MAVIIDEPIDMWRGTEPTIRAPGTVADGGGDDKIFHLRFGRLGAKAHLQKTMTESNSTSTTVDLAVTLTEAETNGLKEAIVDFQIVTDNPIDVLLEGKFRMRGLIRDNT